MLELYRLYINYDSSLLQADNLLPGVKAAILQGKEDELYEKTKTAQKVFQSFVPFEAGGLLSNIKIKYKNVNGGANPPGRTGGTREQFGLVYIPDTDHVTSRTLVTNQELAENLNKGLAGLYSGATYRKALQAFAAVTPPQEGDSTEGWIDKARNAAEALLDGK